MARLSRDYDYPQILKRDGQRLPLNVLFTIEEMNVPAILNSPFLQVALPIMVTFAVASWFQNKRVDDLRSDMNCRFDEMSRDVNRRFDDVIKRLDRITRLEGTHLARPHVVQA